MTEKLNKLYEKIYNDESTKEPRKFIGIVENEIELIENTDYPDYEDYFKATRILADYGINLYNTGYLNKSLKYLGLGIQQLENDKKLKDKDLLEEPLYEALIFHRGMTLYNLKKYPEAKIDFNRLINKFPGNDRYLSWINGLKSQKYAKIEWGFAICAIICLFFSFYLTPENGILDRLAPFGIIFFIIGGLLANVMRKRITRIK
jgi:tetratricopeptide (TPR) repeat protein